MKKNILFLIFLLSLISINISAEGKTSKWVKLTRDFPQNLEIKGIKVRTSGRASTIMNIGVNFTEEEGEESQYAINTFSWSFVGDGWSGYQKLRSYPKDFLGYRTIHLHKPLYYSDAQENADLDDIAVLVIGSEQQLSDFNDIYSSYTPEAEKAANDGNAEAQYLMGYCLLNGKGIARDEERALEYLKKSSDNGYARATRDLKETYFEEGKYDDAIALIQKCPASPYNTYRLGEAYRLKGDIKNAIAYLRQAYAENCQEAAISLFHITDSETEKDEIARDLPYYVDGRLYIADKYEKNQDYGNALKVLSPFIGKSEKAYKKIVDIVINSNDSTYLSEALYYSRIYKDSDNYLRLAGNPNFNIKIVKELASKFKNGSSDQEWAFKLGADKGMPDVAYELAKSYYNNENGQNYKDAISLFKNTADKYHDAYYYLYDMFRSGKGTTANKLSAETYLKKGVALGNKKCLKVLEDRKAAAIAEKENIRKAALEKAEARKELANFGGQIRYDAKANIVYGYSDNTPYNVRMLLSDNNLYVMYKATLAGAFMSSERGRRLMQLVDIVGAKFIAIIRGGRYTVKFTWQ